MSTRVAALPDVAIVGAGLMGHGIAQVFALAGCPVRIWDPSPEALAAVPGRIRSHLTMLGIDVVPDVGLSPSLADCVRDADLVIEAVPEVLAIKQDLMRRLDELAPRAIVATNTSVLRITAIAEASAAPERIVGAHWWNPPYLIPVVEVVKGTQTASATVEAVTAWLRDAGKLPVTVNWDAPGFIGNRMQFALYREALWIVEQGICDLETIDIVARNTFGARLPVVGPIENADYIGLDLTKAILDYLSPHLSKEDAASPVVAALVDEGRLGAKTGGGLADWPDGAARATEERLLEHLSNHFAPSQPPGEGARRGRTAPSRTWRVRSDHDAP